MYSYKCSLKLTKEGQKRAFFGSGPAGLLERIEKTHSISKAAKDMDMAYTKALRILRHAEEVFKFSLVEARTGGKGGGGSSLTKKGKELLYSYRLFEKDLNKKASELFDKHIAPILK